MDELLGQTLANSIFENESKHGDSIGTLSSEQVDSPNKKLIIIQS